MVRKFVWGNWKWVLPTFLFIGALLYHYNYKPETIIKPVIVDPNTTKVKLKDGGGVQIKVSTPDTKTPYEAGFSKAYINDTITKILKIKEKDIKSINKINATFIDSLKLVKEERDESNRMVRYYESRDNKGNIVGNGKVTDGSDMVYKGNVNLTSVVKSGKVDSLKFYDPTGRFTVNNSREFNYALEPKKIKRKLTFSAQTGTGVVVPNFETKKASLGYYAGFGLSYNF